MRKKRFLKEQNHIKTAKKKTFAESTLITHVVAAFGKGQVTTGGTPPAPLKAELYSLLAGFGSYNRRDTSGSIEGKPNVTKLYIRGVTTGGTPPAPLKVVARVPAVATAVVTTGGTPPAPLKDENGMCQ